MSLNTPVAFIIFKRPDLTQVVFNAIRKAQPKQLFVIADGPRSPEEAEKCQKTRDIIKQVDWDCEVLTNFSEVNLTSPIRCSSGIDWVFSQVDEAIILEDDCLPCPSFFSFCETLLDYYRYDNRVMHISGNNFQFGQKRTPYSYYFSKYNHNWGWATWKRAWDYFDFKMSSWSEFRTDNLLNFICHDRYEYEYWNQIFDKAVFENNPHWDYSWTYACWSQNGLSVLPSSNLVSNIGFREDATRTKDINNPVANLATQDIWEIKHPPFIVRHQDADQYTFDHHFGGLDMKKVETLYSKVRRKLSPIKRQVKKLLLINSQ